MEWLQHLPLIIYSFIALFVGLVPMALHKLISPKVRKWSKNAHSSYECGFDPIGDARMPFYIPFYVIGILFVLFDLEMAFLFPWAMIVKHKGSLALLMAGWSFIGILLAGLYYEWKKGVLSCLFSP